MSASYSAIGWNRQKRIYDMVIFVGCILYLTLFAIVCALVHPEMTIETFIIRASSTLAVLLLHIILSIGPLCRLNAKFLPLLYNRRHLGVTMCGVALIHGGFSILQFHSLGNINPIVSVFVSNTNFNSLTAFPFQVLGLLALCIFVIMAVTSHDFWLHNLTPRFWKSLHMLVYLAYLLIILHVVLGVLQYETHPFFVTLISAGAMGIALLHVIAGIKEYKLDSLKHNLRMEGFVYVCDTEEINVSRAKIFCIDEERIAVYNHNGILYAVHNFCKHQGGPLGEGKIIDGCITCPWHGYQYLPHNGQAPPPFTEKVSTYDITTIGNQVWINPTPYPEGTERKGAVIK